LRELIGYEPGQDATQASSAAVDTRGLAVIDANPETWAKARMAYLESPVEITAADVADAFGLSKAEVSHRLVTEGWRDQREAHQRSLMRQERPLDTLALEERNDIYRMWDRRHTRGAGLLIQAVIERLKRGFVEVGCRECKGKGKLRAKKGEEPLECPFCSGTGGTIRQLDAGELNGLSVVLKNCMEIERRVHNRDAKIRTFDENARGFGNVNILTVNPSAGLQVAADGVRLRQLEREVNSAIADAEIVPEGEVD